MPAEEAMALSLGQADAINRGLSSQPVKPRTETPTDPDAILARNLARDFKRQRSAKEVQRSQEERDATKGKFISTLRR